MKQTRLLMGMPITVEIVDSDNQKFVDQVFSYFEYVDQKFSTYKADSEISLINKGEIPPQKYSQDMKTIFALSEATKKETDGYFDIYYNKKIDTSGLVKGWAIYNAAQILVKNGIKNCYVEAGGDIQVFGQNSQKESWKVGIRNPFDTTKIIKALSISHNEGVATSGTYIRGEHIYDPKSKHKLITDIVSLTVIGPNIYEADRFATSAFAMGKKGIYFLENLPGFEAYVIDNKGLAFYTTGFEKFIA